MYDDGRIWRWIEFCRSLGACLTAMRGSGRSFYFIALDLGLHRDRNLKTAADGKKWQVHGGGFYQSKVIWWAPAAGCPTI